MACQQRGATEQKETKHLHFFLRVLGSRVAKFGLRLFRVGIMLKKLVKSKIFFGIL
jgi:hypothetical protein